MMSGGVVPGGICLSKVCAIAVTCALAVAMLAPGWKKNLHDTEGGIGVRLQVLDVIDRRCERCAGMGVMTRPAIWSGGKPWYWNATPMMGMLMLGNISTGMRSAARAPMRKMSKAATMNV